MCFKKSIFDEQLFIVIPETMICQCINLYYLNNILFLLDSSKSMKASITGGSYLGLEGVDWSVALSNGDIIIAEQGRGLVKVSVADNKLDDSFAKNKKNFTVR